MKNTTLKTQLLTSILFSIIIGIGVIFYISFYNLKDQIDNSKKELYEEKVNNMIYLIDQKYQKLQKTQMVESYEDVFKKGTLEAIKEIFDKGEKKIYPFIIDENRFIILHRKFNKENASLYKSKKDYERLIELKDGELYLNNQAGNRWIVFKHYKSWDWIIGYRVNIDEKYKDLYHFRNSFIVTSFVILLIVSILILLIIEKIIEPILNLSKVSKDITAGNLNSKIQIEGAKELRYLASNFEKMRNHILIEMEALIKSEKEVEALNKNLQKLVDERTKELKEQKKSFETLFNESKDGLSIMKDGKFIDCNQALLNLLGLKEKKDLIGLTPNDFSPEYQFDGKTSELVAYEKIKVCMEKGSSRFEWVHKKVTGEEFWTEIIIIKIFLDGNDVIYGIWRDISDKKELELQLHNRNIDLQDSNDELETMIENLRETQNKLVESEKLAGLGSLVAGIAHEINTPIGVCLTGSSHLELLTESIFNKYENKQMSEEDIKEYLNTSKELSNVIHSNLNRTADIIRNFKQVAVDQTSEQKRVFKVKAYIEGVLISIESLLKNKKVDITINCDEDLEIVSYPGFFAQIITNLVENSIEHGFKDKSFGSITFELKKIDNEIILHYFDNGEGMSKENLKKIYEPFFSTNKQNGGSGLGMNIVYNLVTTNLGGTIDCQSKIGEGIKFTIKIPI